MKVLFITNIPSPYRVSFFNELGRLCDLTVLFERKAASDRSEKWKNDDVKNFTPIFLKGKNVGRDTAFCPSVVKYLNKKLFDIIVIGGYSTPTGILAIEYCKIKNIPFLLSVDGGIIKNDKKFIFLIKKHLIESASGWLSSGKKTTEYLKYYGAKEEKIFSYPFTSIHAEDIISSPLSTVEKNKLKRKLNLPEIPTVISVGQFIHRKGFDILLNSWCKVGDKYNLLIIGGGDLKQELINQINVLELKNVHIIDFIEPDALSNYYKSSDLFVLPTREDIWGLVINEAMAYGLPVITTDKCVAGLELITNYENGFIVRSEDIDELSTKINECFSQDNFLEVAGKKSLQKIKDYTIENMAKKHKEIFTSLNFL